MTSSWSYLKLKEGIHIAFNAFVQPTRLDVTEYRE
jgi:hypothetical protein